MKLLRTDPLKVTRDMLDPFHMGMCLSRLNRYGGDGKFPLSVAQHCVLLSYSVPPHLRFAALTHDIPEIWIGEIPATFKDTIPAIAEREDAIMQHIASLYNEPWHHYEELVPFDKAIRNSEVRALFDMDVEDILRVPVEPCPVDLVARIWAGRFCWLMPELETTHGR